jgi:hypothetical protein
LLWQNQAPPSRDVLYPVKAKPFIAAQIENHNEDRFERCLTHPAATSAITSNADIHLRCTK